MTTLNLLEAARDRVEPRLLEALERLDDARPEDGAAGAHRVAPVLLDAMRYALMSPGKRLRPALVLGGAHAVGAPLDDVLPAACAVEMIHAYSLVHDDLPCMDDDDERRGRPSTHIEFSESTALLAGDALLTEALALVADGAPFGEGRQVPAATRALATVELARSAGAAGMVGGQQDDLTYELADAPTTDRDAVLSVHQRKTGRLIQASITLGAIYGGGDAEAQAALRAFGGHLGLAFQLIDDILDGDGVAALDGEDKTRAAAEAHTAAALDALGRFGPAGAPLELLARKMVERKV